MPQAIVDALEVIEVEQQQGAAALFGLCRDQRMLGPVAEQQAVAQPGQRIVVGQVGQLTLGVLDRADVAEDRHVVAVLAVVVAHGPDGLPLRIDLAVLATVPDLPAPLALLGQGCIDRLVERHAVAA